MMKGEVFYLAEKTTKKGKPYLGVGIRAEGAKEGEFFNIFEGDELRVVADTLEQGDAVEFLFEEDGSFNKLLAISKGVGTIGKVEGSAATTEFSRDDTQISIMTQVNQKCMVELMKSGGYESVDAMILDYRKITMEAETLANLFGVDEFNPTDSTIPF